MDGEERAELARRALVGYVHGPEAPIRATSLALDKIETSKAVVLVEGISDQIAIETIAVRRGRDLDDEGVTVLPVGGAQAARRYMREFGPLGRQLNLAGVCDLDAAEDFRRGLIKSGVGNPETAADMAKLGFHVCVEDLEDELIRAVGTEQVEEVLDSQGELESFRTLQRQPAWRGRATDEQLRRFFGTQSRRSLRYARLLIDAAELDRLPRPLDAALAHV